MLESCFQEFFKQKLKTCFSSRSIAPALHQHWGPNTQGVTSIYGNCRWWRWNNYNLILWTHTAVSQTAGQSAVVLCAVVSAQAHCAKQLSTTPCAAISPPLATPSETNSLHALPSRVLLWGAPSCLKTGLVSEPLAYGFTDQENKPTPNTTQCSSTCWGSCAATRWSATLPLWVGGRHRPQARSHDHLMTSW